MSVTRKMDATILIVDDEAGIRSLITGILEDEGYKALQASNSDEAYAEVLQSSPDLIVLDIWLEGSKDDGLQILSRVKAEHPNIPVVMISGHGTVETAVSAIKQGAYDFIEKPFKSDRLLLMVRRALEASALVIENQNLRNVHRGQSQDQDQVVKKASRSATSNSVVYALDGHNLASCGLKEAREIFERHYLEIQIKRFAGNISKTAEFIGMERSALHRKIKILGVDSDGSSPSDDRDASRYISKKVAV